MSSRGAAVPLSAGCTAEDNEGNFRSCFCSVAGVVQDKKFTNFVDAKKLSPLKQ